MKLGLDLKGGINVLLEINQRDLVSDLTNYSTNPIVIEALDKTDLVQRHSTKPYIEISLLSLKNLTKKKVLI
jgi:SecD/SecF fusion protein